MVDDIMEIINHKIDYYQKFTRHVNCIQNKLLFDILIGAKRLAYICTTLHCIALEKAKYSK